MFVEELDLYLEVTDINLDEGTATIHLAEDCEFHIWFLYETETNEYKYISHEYYGFLVNDPKWTKKYADEILEKVLTDFLVSNDLMLWPATDDDRDDLKLVLVKRSTRIYAVQVIENEADVNGHLVCTLCEGQMKYLQYFVTPLNSLLYLYKSNSQVIEEQICIQLVNRYIEEIKKLFFNDALSKTSFCAQNVAVVDEKNLINFYISIDISNIFTKNIHSIVKSFLAEKISSSTTQDWLKMKETKFSKFDLAKFRIEHPDLYKQYVIHGSRTQLTQRRDAKMNFPLNKEKVLAMYKDAMSYLFKNH